MADNVGYTPGSGATIAADDIGGVLYQRMKPAFGADGSATDVSSSNPLPVTVDAELIPTLAAVRVALEYLASQSSRFMPDTSGRNRVAIESGGVTISSGTVTTVTTVTTTGTLTNQTNIGGLAANPQIPYLMMLGADNLRRNITVS
jgi:hypothetical protein